MTCMSCKYSDLPRDNEGKVLVGQPIRICKRYPPAPILLPDARGNMAQRYGWPVVGLLDQCGEFSGDNESTDRRPMQESAGSGDKLS